MKTLKESLFDDNIKSPIPLTLATAYKSIEKMLIKKGIGVCGTHSWFDMSEAASIHEGEFRLQIGKKYVINPESKDSLSKSLEITMFCEEQHEPSNTYVKIEILFVTFDVWQGWVSNLQPLGYGDKPQTHILRTINDIDKFTDLLVKYVDNMDNFLKSEKLDNELIKSSTYKKYKRVDPNTNQRISKMAAKYLGIVK